MPSSASLTEAARLQRLQGRRRLAQAGFFALFAAAPALDLLRFDLHTTQLWLLGAPWHLGIDGLLAGQGHATEAALNLLVRGILPPLLLVVAFLAVARRYGRLYCGWLCPHFSAVETLNGLMHRASGRYSLWDAAPTPHAGRRPRALWWPVFALAAVGAAALWAVTLLTYLLPPAEIWGGLVSGTLTPNQARFVGIGTLVFTAEFVLARHLFCRFGCAVGLFQSLAWMSNPRALVVAFQRPRAADCRGCASEEHPAGDACEAACPMRLRPRREKRWMFSCVQCGRCVTQCAESHAARGSQPNLDWRVGPEALRETLRQRGRVMLAPSSEKH